MEENQIFTFTEYNSMYVIPKLTTPIFEPRKHTKQSYSAQNRKAKKRRNNNQKRK